MGKNSGLNFCVEKLRDTLLSERLLYSSDDVEIFVSPENNNQIFFLLKVFGKEYKRVYPVIEVNSSNEIQVCFDKVEDLTLDQVKDNWFFEEYVRRYFSVGDCSTLKNYRNGVSDDLGKSRLRSLLERFNCDVVLGANFCLELAAKFLTFSLHLCLENTEGR